MRKITIFIPESGEAWDDLLRRLSKEKGDLLLILTGVENRLSQGAQLRKECIDSLVQFSTRLRIASRHKDIVREARAKGIRVIDQVNDLKHLIAGHSDYSEAMRSFSPQIWRQQLRSQLQALGLLSLPKLRIWLFILVSISLLLFIVLKLMPSATITVQPREDTVSQTSNIFLVQSGSTVEIPDRVRKMELKPIRVTIEKTLTFDQISKEFIGTSSRVPMTIINKSDETYSLRATSRLTNQAGMVFRIQDFVKIEPGDEVEVMAEAADLDLYGEITGERGNVPAGLKWDFAGLEPAERIYVYAENRIPAKGGTSLYRTVLQESDLKVAERKLKEDLLSQANNLVDEEISLYNTQHPEKALTRLYYDELTELSFTGVVLPTQFVGEKVASVPVEGTLNFTAYTYDAQYILELLRGELAAHVEEGKVLLPDSVKLERLITHVIDYSDDLSWIKLTVDLSGTEQAVLDPLSPSGARFAKKVRELSVGKNIEDAERILKNLPEVDSANVSVWPPWNTVLPVIPYNISIETGT